MCIKLCLWGVGFLGFIGLEASARGLGLLDCLIWAAFIIAGVLMLLGAFLPDPDINRRDAINRLRDKERARIRSDNARRAGGGE